MTILDLIQRYTGFTFRSTCGGTEWVGACPWCGGNDRFHIWPQKDRWHCLGPSAGRAGCDRRGDSVQFLRDHQHLDYNSASLLLDIPAGHTTYVRPAGQYLPPVETETCVAPCPLWSHAAYVFLHEAHDALCAPAGARALDWLHGRGLTDHTINLHGLGYNPEERYVDRAAWGLLPVARADGLTKRLWLPRGITIPWRVEDEVWGIRVRRPVVKSKDMKYYWLPGGSQSLFNVNLLELAKPAVLCEGEVDAMSIDQVAGDVVNATATGSTQGARRSRWIARLTLASVVLVAFDCDSAGEDAAQYWLNTLPNAFRWRPFWGDVNDLLRDGVDIRSWIASGLASANNEPEASRFS